MRREINLYRARSPWDLFREMDELFNQVTGSQNSRENSELPSFAPAADIRENEKGYLMAFDLPGVSEKDVKIEVKEGLLTITGERRREQRQEDGGWTRTERSFGRFHRSFTLPGDVDPQKIEAQVENGELQLFLPKSEAAKPVSIPIRVQEKSTGEVKGLMERFFSSKDSSPKDESRH